jgi:hypothetical protein
MERDWPGGLRRVRPNALSFFSRERLRVHWGNRLAINTRCPTLQCGHSAKAPAPTSPKHSEHAQPMTATPNEPAAPNPAIACRLQSARYWRGVGEPDR